MLSSITLAMTDAKPSNIKHNRIIVRTNSLTDRASFRSQGCKIIHELNDATAMDCPDNINIQNSEPDAVLHIMDLQADQQIGADRVWTMGYDGSGVTVAVLDTGIDYTHQEFSSIGGSVDGQCFAVTAGDCGNGFFDDNGHGTHVSGIITADGINANAIGVAPKANIWMAKVCDATGSCYTSDIAAAIDYVVNGPDGTPNTGDEPAKIMSISLGGGGTRAANCDGDYLASKVNWAVSNGVTVVVAAGNTGGIVSSPGCASGAISIGAVDKSDVRPSWSGSGSALKIVAPGVSIYSSLPGNSYASWSGTSMATPHVSATVALMRHVNPSLTDSQIKSILYSTAKDLGIAGWDKYYGWGRVDAYSAYLAVKQPTCSSDVECDDGLYCNGIERCINSTCKAGTTVNCSSLNDQCNKGVCDETQDKCIAQPKPDGTSCNDGLFCNVGETCQSGVCSGGSPRVCNDGISCTSDSCNENTGACDYIWPACGLADGCCGPTCNSNDTDCALTKCWSASYQYLYRNNNQAKKFCKCAQGTYGYNSYSYNFGRKTFYYYLDTADNANWAVNSMSSFYPVYRVKCADGLYYPTNKDYFR